MDERDNKALGDGFSIEKASVRLIKAANSMFNPEKKEMSNTEKTSKLSAEDYLDKYLAEFEEEAIPMERYGLLHFSESFASMRVEQERKDKNAIIEQVKFLLIRNGELEQAKKEWSEEKQGLEAKIKHLTQVVNYQG